MLDLVNDHIYYYRTELMTFWNTLGPVGYLGLLSTVGIVGFYMMQLKKRN